ncbi:alpha/beta hydrolase family protein [Saccharothrix saharensis]|uniref:Alpha/beta hydrolase family protein n=1 Tax=Saccharothrix saharensis TaxID=571190 RepID=A0A543J538_9PSEU|nr:lysophospholipase [Saccharothrix saharensis]TQM77939.1 alpha/beta hydrolase family protein [Saccharothrix saharensis]
MRVVEATRAVAREQVLVAMALGIPSLLADRAWRATDPDEGRGLGVLLVPGFGFGDWSLRLTATWLRKRGYVPTGARIGMNVGCTSDLVDRLERRLEAHVGATGGPVVLFGQSRGGGLARLLSVRRPELVRGLVMLASPVLDQLGAHPSVVRVARTLARLSRAGVPGLLNEDCFAGTCYDTNSTAMAAPLTVPAIAVFSRNDLIAPWELCADPCADCVEVSSSHTGMGLDPEVYRLLAPRLAEWARDREPATPAPTPARTALEVTASAR